MVDDVKNIAETADAKAAAEALDRARLARERREAEQRKRLDELRAHAAAAQAQREKRDEERRRRQAEQRARDEDRRIQVEERKRAIWEASINRRETLLQREKERSVRLERQRAAKSMPRPAYAFGSSTPRLLEPLDSAGFFWAARSTNPIDQMNFFESLAASTTNVMFASAPLTRRASALHLDNSDNDNKDESERPAPWSSVARRRTDLVPTAPARPPEPRSGDSTPGSRPGSAMSTAHVVRRPHSAPRRPRPASIAGTGVNTPRGTAEMESVSSTPGVSRDHSAHLAPARKPRPLSIHSPATSTPGEGKPPLHRKPKPSKEHDKSRGKSVSASPGRALSPTPNNNESNEKHIHKVPPAPAPDKSQLCAVQVSQKLAALATQGDDTPNNDNNKPQNKENTDPNQESKPEITVSEPTPEKPTEQKLEKTEKVEKVEKVEKTEKVEKEDKREEKREDKSEESEMTASMISRRITTEEEAKAALAERRRRAREEAERLAEIERQRIQREEEEEAERQRQEEERQKREEEEARELAALQRKIEEEKLRKAIEAQQQLEREEASRKLREEAERVARIKEEEEKRIAAETAEKLRREEAEREERERSARKQRVEAIMARTRLRKQAEEEKKQQEQKSAPALNNGNNADVTRVHTSQPVEIVPAPSSSPATNNGNGNHEADLLGLSTLANTEDKPEEQPSKLQPANPTLETNNGNVGHLSASFIQTERLTSELSQNKLPENILDEDFTTHNGHNTHNVTHTIMQNAI